MPTKHTRPYAESQACPAYGLAVLGLIGFGAYHLGGAASVILTRLAQLPERLVRISDLRF